MEGNVDVLDLENDFIEVVGDSIVEEEENASNES